MSVGGYTLDLYCNIGLVAVDLSANANFNFDIEASIMPSNGVPIAFSRMPEIGSPSSRLGLTDDQPAGGIGGGQIDFEAGFLPGSTNVIAQLGYGVTTASNGSSTCQLFGAVTEPTN
jgi:hypothetical protein